jgi:hypothetical protein
VDNSFKHYQSAHCENGVTASLLRHSGLEWVTEPLVFGIGSGLFYIHIPFLRINGGPAISFRTMPGMIFKRTCKRLDISVASSRFSNTDDSAKALDTMINRGVPVGCQVGVYNLPYFPPEYRFHFNAHNLIVYGKDAGQYLISDPVMENSSSLSPGELAIVRHAKGMLAPKGHMYYIKSASKYSPSCIKPAIAQGISNCVRDMLYIPGNIAGVAGIKYTAGKLVPWLDKLGPRRAGFYLGQIIRMQEEIGTGGGGFRFIYSAFLEQAAEITGCAALEKPAQMFEKSGDLWRLSATKMASALKGRADARSDYSAIADILKSIAALEKEAFAALKKTKI